MLRPVRGYRWRSFILVGLAVIVSLGASHRSAKADTLFVSVDPMVAGGQPGNDVTGLGTRAAPYREISKAVSQLFATNHHVIFVGPSRGSVYSGGIYTPYDWAVKIVSEKGPDSTVLTNGGGAEVVDLNADTVLQILEGFTIADNVVNACEGICVGGVYAYGNAWVINNKILRNTGKGGPGGIYYGGVIGYGGIIAGNWIANNHDANGFSAGGIQTDYAWSLSIINNTIIGNTGPNGAGIQIGSDAQNVTIANNIIAYNLTGFGIHNFASGVVAENNLFYSNEAGDAFGLGTLAPSNIIGPGADPLLAGLGAFNYHQTCNSPGRNAGSNSYLPAELVTSGSFDWDIDGPPQARIYQTTIDIGGDEFWDTNKHASFTATITTGCNSLATQFENTSTCIDEQWFWDFGDGGTSNNRDPAHTYLAPGNYNVRLIAKGVLDADTLVRANYIKVVGPLSLSFAADPVAGIDTLTVTFTSSVVADSLRWIFGDGGTAKGNPVSHTYTKPGFYGVELRGYNLCGMASLVKPSLIYVGSKMAPPAETLFVSIDPLTAGGNPGNDSTGIGTRSAPYREISRAVPQVIERNTHVIFVGPSRGGFYSGPVSTLYDWPLKIISEKGADSTLVTSSDGSQVVSIDADTALQLFEGFTVANNVIGGCEGACVGGIYAYGRAWIINNKVYNNVGGGGGGGIYYYGIPAFGGIIAGNWISGNRDAGGIAGGGIQVDYSSSLSIINNTIIGNTAQTGAGINLSLDAAGVIIANNIIAYNLSGFGINKVSASPSTIVAYNLFYQNTAGNTANLPPLDATNLNTNPFLVDYNKRNYHLTCGSAARNHGSNGYVPLVLTNSGDFAWDGDLNPTGSRQGRIFQTIIDIGADEFWDTDKHAIFDATPKVGCNSMQVSFSNFSTCIDEQWIWSFGDGGTSNQKNPVHTYTGPGSYSVTLIARGDLDSDTLTIPDFIKVVPPLDISFTADVVKGCDSLFATFTAVTNVSADSLRWYFGDGGTATGNPATHKFTKIGVFDVTLIGYNPCGPDTALKPAYITVGAKPVIIITASSDSSSAPKCIPYEVRLHTVTSQPLNSWTWDFGDSDTTGSHLSDPVHTYTRTDTFSVRLIVSGDCGSDTVVRPDYLAILPRPTATLDATPKAVCASGQSVNFTATYHGTVDSSRWLFGDGGSAAGPNARHEYPGAGIYQPRLILYHPCATDTLPLDSPVGVGIPPIASLYGAPRTGFEPLATQFSDSSRNLPTSWQWVFGDGATSTEQDPLHTYAPGVWDVSLTASNVCGTSQSSVSQYVRVGGFLPSLDSTGSNGDTIHFNVLVDSLVYHYDRPITLRGSLGTEPRRGSATFVFGTSTGTPRFATTMTMIPSFDLPSGDYTVRVSAIDPRITKTADRIIHYVGHQFVDITPESLNFGKQLFGGPYGKQAYVHNRAPAGSGLLLSFTANDSGGGYIARASGTIGPQDSAVVQVSFLPARKGDYIGALIVTSDDPVLTRDRIPLRGKGTPDLILPRVAATVPEVPLGEIRIDSTVRFMFTEPMIAPGADSIVSVTAKRFLRPVAGHLVYSSGSRTRPFTWIGFTPDSCIWLPPDDTLRFRIRAAITDTSENGLDGDSNGIDEGSPADDYLLSVATGPGVRPGDADQDFHVDERDILPLARYWGLTGPPRNDVCDGFVVQPASPWNPRAATNADADGNGVIDSADICPIAQYFDMVVATPKLEVEKWMNEARTWDKSIVRSLLNGLVNCPNAGPGQAVLHRFLEEVQSEAAVPENYSLSQNYPNPFNPSTVIEYTLKTQTKVRLEIFDVTGRLVTVLEDSEQSAGHHTRIWDGTDGNNRSVASGIYFYRLVTPEFHMARKMVLMK